MADARKLREVVERIVSQTLDAHVSSLSAEIVDGACREIEPLLAESAPSDGASATAPAEQAPAGGLPTDLLNAAFATVLDSQSQADILTSLLDGSAKFSQRSALFVIKSGNAVGWRARGFDDNAAIKNIQLDPTVGLAGRCYNHRQLAQAAAAEFDSEFISTFGEPQVGTNAIVLPLVVRDKVAALVYADGGATGKMDPSALECLVRGASLWLEIVAARKSGAPAPVVEPPPVEAERTGTQKIPVMAEAQEPPPPPAYEPVPAAVIGAASTEPEPAGVPAVAAVAAAPVPAAGMSSDDEEVHKKAKRFAKLLVEEIKLYNQKKVDDGRSNRDLYQRLKDDIDKSRASYDKRYGQTPAGSANYFNQELIRILCEGDPSLMGTGFSG